MSNFLRIRGKSGDFNSFQVPEPVYIYVKQLEHCIKYPKDSLLLKAYPDLAPIKPAKKKGK